MIQKAIVRNSPKRGKRAKYKAVVYLPERWLGKKIIAIPYDEFITLRHDLKEAETKLKRIWRLTK